MRQPYKNRLTEEERRGGAWQKNKRILMVENISHGMAMAQKETVQIVIACLSY